MDYRPTNPFAETWLVASVAIAVAVLGLVTPAVARSSQQRKAKQTAAKADILSLEIALDALKLDTGGYPIQLQALAAKTSDASGWRGPYVKALPSDPWGNAYVYVFPPKNNEKGVELSSAGADGKIGTEDDINNWGNEP